MTGVCAMAVPAKTDAELLEEARGICRQVANVWFTKAQRLDPVSRAQLSFYRIYRRGMGEVATRSSPAGLVAYLRAQVPR